MVIYLIYINFIPTFAFKKPIFIIYNYINKTAETFNKTHGKALTRCQGFLFVRYLLSVFQSSAFMSR